MEISIPKRARDLAAQLREHAAQLTRNGSREAAARALAKAEEVEELGRLATLAEDRLGAYLGPSSATLPPPPVVPKPERTKAKRRGRPSYADRLIARAS